MTDPQREVWYLEDSDQLLTNIHPEKWCSGKCVVHRPSGHNLRKHPLMFDEGLKAFYRVCKHGNLHHDPDERSYWVLRASPTARITRAARAIALEKLAAWRCPDCACYCCCV